VARTLTLGAAYFYVISNITIIVTMLPFMVHDIETSQLQKTILISIFPLISLPANLIIGPIADRFGRRRFLIIGAVACAILFAMASAVTNAWEAIVLRGITAISMSMVSCSIFSSIPDYFAPDKTMKVTGYVSAAASLAQLVAIPLVLLIAETAGWRASFLVLAIYAFVLTLMIVALPAPEYAGAPKGRMAFRSQMRETLSIFNDTALRRPLTGYAIFACGTFIFISLYPTWLLKQHFDVETGHNVSLIFLSGGLGGLSGALLTGFLGPRLASSRKLCSILSVLTAISVGVVPFTGIVLGAQIAAYCLVCACRAVLIPFIINTTMTAVAPNQRGSANGIMAAVFQTGTALGATIGAQLYAADVTFVANAAVASSLFLASTLVFAKTRRVGLATS
jgi:predicted MFS family arabinose efflux permease